MTTEEKTKEPYRKYVSWIFDCAGENWEMSVSPDRTSCRIEETRKSGHEDTHMAASIELVGGKWKIEYPEYSNIDQKDCKKIEAYLNEHGLPADG